jgi:WD40 repeat protein
MIRSVAAALVLAAVPCLALAQDPKKDLPLIPTRPLAVDTDEGSWISVDVSPDGKTIVFDVLGDRYTIPIGGGAATPISTGMAFDGQPRFSPDGRWIAFTSDRDGAENLWIQNLETKETRQITKLRDKTMQSPEWTPDGKYLVVSIGEIVFKPAKLWLFHVDGGTGIQLIKQDVRGQDLADSRRRRCPDRGSLPGHGDDGVGPRARLQVPDQG